MELKFGHRVIAWKDNDAPAEKGRYVSYYYSNDPTRGFPHYVLLDGTFCPTNFRHAKLDPDATEFLPGDEVEVSFDKFLQNEWYPAIYLGKYKGEHFVTSTDSATPSGWPRCRYPRGGGGGGKYSLNGKTAIIDGKEYELRLK